VNPTNFYIRYQYRITDTVTNVPRQLNLRAVQLVGFTIFPNIVALVHKKPYVDDYCPVRRFGEEPPRRPLTRPHLLLSKRTAHHDGQRLWRISALVA
jgi:hypothetical protein